MSTARVHAQISGPAEHRAAILERLNDEPRFVAFPIEASDPGDSHLAWIEVRAYQATDATESAEEFQRQFIDAMTSDLVTSYDFRLRSSGVPLSPESSPLLSYKLTGPLVSPTTGILFEPINVDVLWDQLRRVANAPQTLARFNSIKGADRLAITHEFSSFILQAEAYFRAGSKTEGPSAALLLYYSLLNLAKAELILWKPTLILDDDQRIHHGLSAVHPTPHINDWTVKIQRRGVFASLYEKRLDAEWSRGYGSVAAVDLFARCPETGLEFGQAGYGQASATGFYHAIVTDGAVSWSEMMVANYNVVLNSRPTRDLLIQHYQELEGPRRDQDVHEIFGISRRMGLLGGKLLLSRNPKAVRTGRFVATGLAHEQWLPETKKNLLPLLGDPKAGYDGVLSNSLSNDSLIAFPDDLARYAAVYLVSSLVRYRPSALNATLNPVQSWYLSAFVRQCSIPALHSFVNRILDKEMVFVDVHRT